MNRVILLVPLIKRPIIYVGPGPLAVIVVSVSCIKAILLYKIIQQNENKQNCGKEIL